MHMLELCNSTLDSTEGIVILKYDMFMGQNYVVLLENPVINVDHLPLVIATAIFAFRISLSYIHMILDGIILNNHFILQLFIVVRPSNCDCHR